MRRQSIRPTTRLVASRDRRAPLGVARIERSWRAIPGHQPESDRATALQQSIDEPSREGAGRTPATKTGQKAHSVDRSRSHRRELGRVAVVDARILASRAATLEERHHEPARDGEQRQVHRGSIAFEEGAHGLTPSWFEACGKRSAYRNAMPRRSAGVFLSRACVQIDSPIERAPQTKAGTCRALGNNGRQRAAVPR